jgi:ribonuclease R
MFCQGIEIPAEGMIHLSALADDFYVFDQATRRLTGSRTKREFRLGDPIRVVVAAVDIDRRMLDLRPVSEPGSPGNRTPRRPSRPSAEDSRDRRGNSRAFPEPRRGGSKGKAKGKSKSKGNTKKGRRK